MNEMAPLISRYAPIQLALSRFSAANSRITDGDYTAGDIKEAELAARAGTASEADVIAELRVHLAEDIVRRAERYTDRLSSDSRLMVNVASLNGSEQNTAKQILETIDYVAVTEGGDLAISAVEEITGLIRQRNSGPNEPKPAMAPRVEKPGHLITTPGTSGMTHHAYGGFVHGGLLNIHGRWIRLLSGRMQFVQRAKRMWHDYQLVSTQIFEVDEKGNNKREVVAVERAPPNPQRLYWSTSGYDAHYALTGQGLNVGWSAGARALRRQPACPFGRLNSESSFLITPLRTRAVMERFNWMAAGPSGTGMKRQPFEEFKWPDPSETELIADAVNPNSPFNAYFNPDEKGPGGLVIYASPYLKVISAGPGDGPTLIVFPEARNFHRVSKNARSNERGHIYRMVVFEKDAAPIVL